MKHSNQKMANPNVLTRTKTNTPRNAFDMSHDVYMHSPVGMIIPSFVQDIKPNDYFTLDVSSYARTVPVNTAAFCRMKEYTDFYFVPLKQIWQPFEQMINPVPDVRSALSLASQKSNTVSSMPFFTFGQFMSIMSDTNIGGSGSYLFNVSPKAYAARLFDQLGYFSNPLKAFSPGTADHIDGLWNGQMSGLFPNEQRFNPYRLLAFNRILNDYYRQTDYVAGDARLFNVDDIESGTQLPDERLRAILRCPLPSDITYSYQTYCIFPFVKWNLDNLTATKPSQLYGSFTNPSNVNSDDVFTFRSSLGSVFSSDDSIGNNAVINTQDLRVAHALEKIARVSMAAPKTFKAQQEAHFGVSSESCDSCSIRYLGSYRSDLEIGEVIATSNYDSEVASNYLGQVSGKGVCSGHKNGVIKMHSKDFGVIIGVHYVKPDAEYQMNRYNPLVSRFGRSDFFVPEFDQLGLEPCYRGEYAAKVDTNMDIVGYRSRYSNLKSRVSEVHGNFQKARNLSAWAMARNPITADGSDLSLYRFYVDPRVADTLFEHDFDGTEVTDQFICHYLYNATLVSDMSINGIPTL